MNAIIVTGGDIDIPLLENYIAENKEDVIISVDAAITKLEKINVIHSLMGRS